MGKLITLTELSATESDKATWYLADSYFNCDKRCYNFPWPNKEFPYTVAIHADEILDNKLSIRKWIERNDVGTVIYEYVRKSYTVWRGPSRDWDKTTEISNCWNVFYFEDSETALAFTLQFSNLVRPMTENHPTRHYGERRHY